MIEEIKANCEHYENLINKKLIYCNYLYLQECTNSKENGLYQLILNGYELHYGTLQEINAVIKSLIKLKENAANYSIR